MKRFFLFFILTTCMTISCSKIDINMDRAIFDKEFAAWSAQNMENYKFTYDIFNAAGPHGPISVTIAENEDLVIENLGYSSFENYPLNIIKSMSGVFDFIRETFDDIERTKKSSNKKFTIESISLRISYNKQFHYPEKVSYGVFYKQKGVLGAPHYDLNITEFISY